jgi:hypothetical protein
MQEIMRDDLGGAEEIVSWRPTPQPIGGGARRADDPPRADRSTEGLAPPPQMARCIPDAEGF